ncbi:peptidoglycan-binding protein [Tychonema sp. LEGE 07199]|uniref:peptidoglycan-binding domain-containing protein n=1 Tax=unclassified Tychonema TaxID=2642144 RepID=UPI0018822282|nr:MULTISPECIES: peptidoglycan-binding protein [unclassified Tychonema]MBE9119749.1 peptidoglycan-binding protein [Tychonema sp. LEGE 07199]MBE9131640.1 peptidoglycan-binding protein [Tychonema sp. LEGE 07196]
MRLTTVTIFSLLALFAPGLTKKANAAFDSKPFVQEQYRRDFVSPADPGASTQPEANSQGGMFNKPFYSGEQQPVRKEKTISAGADGPEVAAIQQRLQVHGFAIGKIDGSYGSRTKSAVSAFQKSQRLNSDGIVDKQTWTALAADPVSASESLQSNAPVQSDSPVQKSDRVPTNPATALTKGAAGSKVKTLQVRLEMQGYDPGPIDGIFGTRTTTAVKSFQQYKGLTADGVVDEITWKAIGQN